MVAVPQEPPFDANAELARWQTMHAQLASLKVSEILLRKKLFDHFFPSPEEGTNTVELGNGWKLKAKHPIDRKVDEGALAALKQLKVSQALGLLTQLGLPATSYDQDKTVLEVLGISADKLVKFEPSLVIKPYRTLTAEQAKVFEQCLIIKPGSPSLEITPPKETAA